MYNIHSHCFTLNAIPENYIPGFNTSWFKDPNFKDTALWMLRNMNPFNDNDSLDKVAAFVTTGNQEKQITIFEQLKSCYPDGTKFVLLPMDFRFVGGGSPAQDMKGQYQELKEIKDKYPNEALPFAFLEPRNPNLLSELKMAIEEYGFYGAKIYPKLGYFPNDERLFPAYEYLQSINKPVITHGSKAGVFGWETPEHSNLKKHYQGDCPSWWSWSWTTDMTACVYTMYLKNFKPVLEKFPNLRIDLAHIAGDFCDYLGGKRTDDGDAEDDCWAKILIDMLRQYPNCYTDVSCNLGDTSYDFNHKGNIFVRDHLLTDPKIKDKVLFGSDWYMTTAFDETIQDNNYQRAVMEAWFGVDTFKAMSDTNCKTFLGL